MLPLSFYLALIDDKEDHNRFTVLYNEYWQDTWYVANKVLKDAQLSEEIVQETFIIVARKIADIDTDNPKRAKAYIATIAQHLAYEKAKERKNEIITKTGDILEEKYPVPINYEDKAIDISRRRDFIECAKKLDKKFFVVIKLRADGHSFKEIGDTLSITDNTAKQRYHRGIKKILEMMGEI